jgi:transcription elongation factor Elf1
MLASILSIKAKNCPFCNNSEILSMQLAVEESVFCYYCTVCSARGPAGNTKNEAAGLWNRARRPENQKC